MTDETKDEDKPAPEPTASPAGQHRLPGYDTFAQLLNGLEDGELAAQLTAEMEMITQTLVDHFKAHGGKPKGKLALAVDFKLQDGVFEIVSTVKTTTPQPPRSRSIVWPTADGRLTPANPAQEDMFKNGPVRSV